MMDETNGDDRPANKDRRVVVAPRKIYDEATNDFSTCANIYTLWSQCYLFVHEALDKKRRHLACIMHVGRLSYWIPDNQIQKAETHPFFDTLFIYIPFTPLLNCSNRDRPLNKSTSVNRFANNRTKYTI
jgi:hypothetical protein